MATPPATSCPLLHSGKSLARHAPPATAGILSALLTYGRAYRTAGLPAVAGGRPARRLRPACFSGAGAFSVSCVITHHPSLITEFLIYGSAIRNPRKALKT